MLGLTYRDEMFGDVPNSGLPILLYWQEVSGLGSKKMYMINEK